MRYDGKKLHIGVKELVGIARRGISAAVPRDEDEPRLDGAASDEKASHDTVTLLFSQGEEDYVLEGNPVINECGEIILCRFTDGDPTRLRKEELAQIRGEGFLLAYMYCVAEGKDGAVIRLTVTSPDTEARFEKEERVGITRLEEFFQRCITTLSVFARPEIDRVKNRLPSLKTVKFPYGEVREGQADFVRACYRAICRHRRLLAGAPTGTGKTVSVLYPALKALGEERCDKVFYLTPKTTTARSAKECLELFAKNGASVRAVILTAKSKLCSRGTVCKTDRRACDSSACNRLSEAVTALYGRGAVCAEGELIKQVAAEYKVCPYELSLTYSELCDVVICDLNYLFDPTVYIRRFFDEGGRYAFLIDEAHNLPDRLREMRSCEIGESTLRAIADSPLLGELSPLKVKADEAHRELNSILYPFVKEELRTTKDDDTVGAQTLSFVPTKLYSFADEMLEALEKELLSAYAARDEYALPRVEFIREHLYLFKDLKRALRSFDDGYRLMIFCDGGKTRMKLCLFDTGATVKACTDKGISTVFFSATLEPSGYYAALLGLEDKNGVMTIPSPFDKGAVSVSIMDRISTRYSERERTLPAVCRVIAATLAARKGHYMVFAPSFEYAEALHSFFTASYPRVKAMLQSRESSYKDKQEFLSAFAINTESYLVGFCVMGGVYSEGVDLVGDKLIGAVVVGIGMPTLSYERERMCDYFEDRFEQGKEFAYVYPGMNKVFQAAGRVIRTEGDRGVIVLVDDRFADPIYKKSIPSLWSKMEYIEDAEALKERLDDFWRLVDSEMKKEGLDGFRRRADDIKSK